MPLEITRAMLARSRVLARGRGIRDVDRLVKSHGGKSSRWTKKSSPMFEVAGSWYEFHWYEY